MVKLFVGNIAEGVPENELRDLFASYGTVTECSVLGNYGFVHLETETEADDAIKNLDKHQVHGQELHVERGKSSGSGGKRGGMRNDRRSGNGFGGGGGPADNSSEAKAMRRAGCTKLHVANLADGVSSNSLRVLFERYGYVAECDVVEDRKIAFVHIENGAADAAIRGLNGRDFWGMQLKVQMSKNQNNEPAPSGGSFFRGGVGGSRGGFGDRARGRGPDGYLGGMGSGLRGRSRPISAYEGYGDDMYGGYDDHGEGSHLPPLAKGRAELLELLDRRRRLEALDPYERRLIACPDPFNLPPPPPEYLRLLRERAMVKARLPLPPTTASLGTRGSAAQSSPGSSTASLQRALIARRAAAVAASAREKLRSSAGVLDAFGEDDAVGDDYMYGGLGDY